MKKVLHWIDDNIISVIAGFLLVFIPLYPKWPLFDVLYGYNVRVRLEDFFVAAAIVLYIIWFLRKKFTLAKELTVVGLIGYLVIGLISTIVAIFVVQTIPLEKLQVEKTFLHWLRRAEYFSLFFMLFSSVKSLKQVKVYLCLFFVTLLAVIIYGYGQKYLYWPAFSTMNREFSKGWWLYLSEHARVLSTFGGHYDLAGYLVITLTLAWSIFFSLKKWIPKILMGLLIAGGFWLLILTASRISFAGYMIGLSFVCFFWMFKKGLGWGLSRWVVTISLSMLIMLSFGDLSERFLRVIHLEERVTAIKAMVLNPTKAPPKNNAVFLQNNTKEVASVSDTPPTPADVNKDAPPLIVQTTTATGASVLVQKPRTYSANSVMYDLSTGIRLDATWPRAIAGFKANPLTGSGYATLTRTTKYQFTEAESTDSDYLRALGETGALGFLFFFGTIFSMALMSIWALGGIKDNTLYALSTALIGVIFGLLVNASVIDIFEASKVAYVFWGFAGLVMGSLYLNRKEIKENRKQFIVSFSTKEIFLKIIKIFRTDVPWVILVLILTFSLRLYKYDTPLADWHSWRQADTSAVTRNFDKEKKINFLYPTFDDLSSVPSGKPNPTGIRMVEFPLYNAASYTVKIILGPEISVEEAGRITSALMSCLTALFIFLICRKFFSRRLGYIASLVFTVMPYNIFYGRTILPDPSMVSMSMGAVWFASQYLDFGKKRNLIITVLTSTAALLIKPYAVFLLAPIAYLMAVNFKENKNRVLTLALVGLLSFLPLLLWRQWIKSYPEGVPASDWLYNGNGIRFKGAFWYWLFADRIGRLILGYWGLVLLGFGLVRPLAGKFKLFPLIFFGSSLLYLFIFATGNVQHDYYQILLTPSLAILVGLGFDYLFSLNIRAKALAISSVLFMIAFGWYFVKDYYNINHPEIVAAGKKLNDITDAVDKRGALVIAPYNGDTAFLYQTNHKGWPLMDGSIDDLINKGANYYVSTTLDFQTKELLKDAWPVWEKIPIGMFKKYKLLAQTDQYVIIQLVPDNKITR